MIGGSTQININDIDLDFLFKNGQFKLSSRYQSS